MGTPIKVIAYRGDRAGCWFYRLHAPLRALSKNTVSRENKFDIFITGTISKDHFESKKFDIALLQRQYSPDVYNAVAKMQAKGTKLIYEIDDDMFHIPDWNPAAKVINNTSVQKNVREFVKLCDAVFVSTQQLKDIYSEFNNNIYVLENAIDRSVIVSAQKNTVKPVVCWQGSATHTRDLEVARKSMEALALNQDIILKMWCGFKRSDDGEKSPVFDIEGAEIIPLVPFEAFYQMFSQMGISVGLAPLVANTFNKGKSNLKFLEYTVQDAVTVASNFGPYKDTIEDGVTGILVSDNRDWYDKVIQVTEDKDLYQKLLSNAKELLNDKYDIEKTWVNWDSAFKAVLEGSKK